MTLVSVILCTIRRFELYSRLIEDLYRQTYPDLEILVVGRAGDEPPEFPANSRVPVEWMPAPKGLAPARNVGIARARGDIVIFFDDDVTIPETFLADAVATLARPEHAGVGGLTGYDTANYNYPVSARWKLRKMLGITPSLEPGDSDHLGRSVTLAFQAPFTGVRAVKWLPGFCQIFRHQAIEGLRYDERIVVEDRDFSMKVGENWRLLFSGDLKLAHHRDEETRHSQAFQTWRAAFGLGRSFAKRSKSARDLISAVHVFLGEAVIDALIFCRQPRLVNLDVAWSRMKGFLAGYRSWGETERLANIRPAGHQAS